MRIAVTTGQMDANTKYVDLAPNDFCVHTVITGIFTSMASDSLFTEIQQMQLEND